MLPDHSTTILPRSPEDLFTVVVARVAVRLIRRQPFCPKSSVRLRLRRQTVSPSLVNAVFIVVRNINKCSVKI
jgi:hypothetical protein